jgi:exocyst complex component 5
MLAKCVFSSLELSRCRILTPLLRDLKSYQDTINSFSIPSLSERFEFIRQLGNVFLIQPDILKSYITEGYLGRIDSSLLRPYLAMRSDWVQFEDRFNDEGDNLEDSMRDSNQPGTVAGLKKDRFGMGRLSTMMRDLEGLKLDGVRMSGVLPRGFSPGFTLSNRMSSSGAN